MRRRRAAGDRWALLEEATGCLIMTDYGLMVGAPHTVRSYDRLLELADELGMPSPPALSEWTSRDVADAWAIRAGLLHDRCRSEQHWAFHCRG